MQISTTAVIAGYKTDRNLGLIWVESVKGVNAARDMFGKVRNFFGGNVKGYEKELAALKKEAVNKLVKRAKEIHANGIIGASFDLETIVMNDGLIMAMTATGTAVIVSSGDGRESESVGGQV